MLHIVSGGRQNKKKTILLEVKGEWPDWFKLGFYGLHLQKKTINSPKTEFKVPNMNSVMSSSTVIADHFKHFSSGLKL